VMPSGFASKLIGASKIYIFINFFFFLLRGLYDKRISK
jgi:hypothetical protein